MGNLPMRICIIVKDEVQIYELSNRLRGKVANKLLNGLSNGRENEYQTGGCNKRVVPSRLPNIELCNE